MFESTRDPLNYDVSTWTIGSKTLTCMYRAVVWKLGTCPLDVPSWRGSIQIGVISLHGRLRTGKYRGESGAYEERQKKIQMIKWEQKIKNYQYYYMLRCLYASHC